MFKGLKPIVYGGREVWPLVEGGKGVAATNHASAGAWAAAGGIGTVSAVNADSYDPDGKIIPQIYRALTRRERHEELIAYAIEGAVQQVQRAWEIAGGKGAININVLWEMGGAPRVLHGVLERTRGLVAGVTCGAGMPYKLSEIAASYNVNYLPIVSSGRAFLAGTDVDLTLDTGHLFIAGGDPVAAVDRWGGRINHLHLKDVDLAELRRVIAAGGGMADVWSSGAFVAFGAGDIDLAAVMDAVDRRGFDGWIVVEQDVLNAPDVSIDAFRTDRTRDQTLNREALRPWA